MERFEYIIFCCYKTMGLIFLTYIIDMICFEQ